MKMKNTLAIKENFSNINLITMVER